MPDLIYNGRFNFLKISGLNYRFSNLNFVSYGLIYSYPIFVKYSLKLVLIYSVIKFLKMSITFFE